MLEGVVAEVQVWSVAFHNGDDWVFRYAEQVHCYIGAGAGSVSFFKLPWDVCVNLHRSANNDNTLHANCQRRSQPPRQQLDSPSLDKHPDPYNPSCE
jgi:hypothetical protein